MNYNELEKYTFEKYGKPYSNKLIDIMDNLYHELIKDDKLKIEEHYATITTTLNAFIELAYTQLLCRLKLNDHDVKIYLNDTFKVLEKMIIEGLYVFKNSSENKE